MKAPPENDNTKKGYTKPLSIFEASDYIKISVPIIDSSSDSANQKNDEIEKGKEEGPNILFPINQIF